MSNSYVKIIIGETAYGLKYNMGAYRRMREYVAAKFPNEDGALNVLALISKLDEVTQYAVMMHAGLGANAKLKGEPFSRTVEDIASVLDDLEMIDFSRVSAAILKTVISAYATPVSGEEAKDTRDEGQAADVVGDDAEGIRRVETEAVGV